jgi:tetratricopeptide (TPR) repeat protein
MVRPSTNTIATFVIALAAALTFPAVSRAQRGRGGSTPTVSVPLDETDYNAWNNTKDTAKKIQLGEKFVANYPGSQYSGLVYDQLVVSYYTQQDWNDFYADADKAIAKHPDDINILTLVGWVIPHQYNPDDIDASKKIEKAQAYEKHAMDVIANLSKPATLSDEQFAAAKSQRLEQAHSGLGLIYFRKLDYDNSVKELQQATQMAAPPDTTDLYALGIGLEQLNRYGEAADAFQKCSEIPSQLQDRCRLSADQDKIQAAAQPK